MNHRNIGYLRCYLNMCSFVQEFYETNIQQEATSQNDCTVKVYKRYDWLLEHVLPATFVEILVTGS